MSASEESNRQALLDELSATALKNTQEAVNELEKSGDKGFNLAMALLQLGCLQMRAKQIDNAQKNFEKALKVVDNSKEEGVWRESIDGRIYLSHCYLEKNEMDAAEKILQEALKIAVANPDSRSLSYQMKVYEELAHTALKAQKYDQAESYVLTKKQLYHKLFPEYGEEEGLNHDLLAEIKIRQGKKQEAEALLKQSLEEQPNSIGTMYLYAELLRSSNRVAEATALEKKAEELKHHGENIMLSTFMAVKGMQMQEQAAAESDWGKELKAANEAQKSGDFEKALSGYKSVLETLKRRGQLGSFRAQAWNPIVNLAFDLQKQRDFRNAAALMAVVEPFACEAEGDDRLATSVMANAGSAQMNAGRLVDAEKTYRRAIDVFARSAPVDNQWYCYALNNLALCLKKQKKFEEAAKTYNNVTTNHIKESNLGAKDRTGARAIALMQTLLEQALLLSDTGQSKQADAVLVRARGLLKFMNVQEEVGRMDSLIEMLNENGKLVEAEQAAQVKKLFLTKISPSQHQ